MDFSVKHHIDHNFISKGYAPKFLWNTGKYEIKDCYLPSCKMLEV